MYMYGAMYIAHVSLVGDCVVSLPGRHTHQGQQCEGHLCAAGEQTDREVKRRQVLITVYKCCSLDRISLNSSRVGYINCT